MRKSKFVVDEDGYRFWLGIRTQRNNFLVKNLLLLFVGFPCLYFVLMLFFPENEKIAVGIVMVVFVVFYLAQNFIPADNEKLLCPKCGNQVIDHFAYFLQEMKCEHCGFAYKDTIEKR